MVQGSFLEVFAQKEATRFKLKVGVFVLIIQKEEVLLLRRYRTGIADGLHVVPMGGHDGKEPLTTTLIREAKEETNITVRPEDAQVCHVMHRLHPMPAGLTFEQIDVFFKVETFQGNIENMEPDKCDELKFYPLNQLPTTTEPFICQAITCTQKGQFYSEFGWS